MSMIFGMIRSLGLKTATASIITAASLWGIATVIHMWDFVVLVWAQILFLVSFGGHFWGAFMSSAVGGFILLWAWCVYCALSRILKKDLGDNKKWLSYLTWIMIFAFILWGISAISLINIFSNMQDWNAFQGMAIFILILPVLVVVIAILT